MVVAVLYTSNEVAGVEMVAASFVPVRATLGTSNPLLGFFTSSIALVCGAVPSLFIPTLCACTVLINKQDIIKGTR